MSNRAEGTFAVKITPKPAAEDAPALAAMTLDKQYQGSLQAAAKGHMLSAAGSVPGSAAYVALEQVSGSLDGRTGGFILMHTGVMTRGAPQLTITVVPDSGTGELTGLTGAMTITIAGGAHSYQFDYEIAG